MKKITEMTLKEKIGQLLIIGFPGEEYSESLDELIEEYSIGNIILFTRNIKNINQLHKLNETFHQKISEKTGIMPFISIDQEGGMVTRIMDEVTFFPGAMTIGATNTNNAYKSGKLMGEELATLGINFNLAPSLDVNNNPYNPVIGVRSFSDNADKVARFGIEYIKGLQEEGIIATAKHFPGHGDTDLDSHKSLPTINHDKIRLEEVELYPFKKAINAGVDAIMSAHVFFPSYEQNQLPATLSHNVLTKLLKDEMGFKGLVVSDCMEMKAIDDNFTTPIGSLKGLLAGLDMVLVSHTKEKQIETFNLIYKAVKSGEFPMELLNEKIEKILRYKEKSYKVLKKAFFDKDYDEKYNLLINKNSKEFAYKVVANSFTLVKGKKYLPYKKTLVIATEPFATTTAEDELSSRSIVDSIKENKLPVETKKIKVNISDDEISDLIKQARFYEQVVVFTYNAVIYNNQAKLVKRLNSLQNDLFVISTRNPFDIIKFDNIENYLCFYEYTTNSVKAIIKFLQGDLQPLGKLPVSFNKEIELGASIYVGLDDYSLEANLNYLTKLKDNNVKLLFVSAHMPEMNKDRDKELFVICSEAKKLGFRITLDVSKPMFDNFNMPNIDVLRLDYGFRNEDILDLVNQGYLIELNASTISANTLEYLINHNIDMKKIRVSHNFYPKPFTGLSYQNIEEKNKMFKKYDLTIMGYIASMTGKRPPIYEGLPTLEYHRYYPVGIALQEMKLLGFDEVFFGDGFIGNKELEKLADYPVITLPIVIKKGISKIERELLLKKHRTRTDESLYLKRSTMYRNKGQDIVEFNNVEREYKDIVIDNRLYKRYVGEVCIIMRDGMGKDKRVNVVARTIASDYLLQKIKPGMEFAFEIIGEE